MLGISSKFRNFDKYNGHMLPLPEIGEQVAARRKARKLSQTALARSAGVSRATLEALENARIGELGYAKLSRVLAVLGLEMALREARTRPTLDDLMEENRHDESLGRRG